VKSEWTLGCTLCDRNGKDGIEKEAIAELRRLFECQTNWRDIVLDLKDVGVKETTQLKYMRPGQSVSIHLDTLGRDYRCANGVQPYAA
jgi:hypothetical protein